ncbi:unnamed protein product [Amoebophrya sp. A120]|nr:unnamed protein product [Amoebophrya sp. A120]|eukprot:GSA120T00001766001.1
MPCPCPAARDLLVPPPPVDVEGLTLHYHYQIVSRPGAAKSPGSPAVEMALQKLQEAAELISRENGSVCQELLERTRLNLKQLNMMVMDSRGVLNDAEYALLVSVRELINTIEDDEVRLSVMNSDTIARCIGTGAAAEQRRKLVLRLRDIKSEARREATVDMPEQTRFTSHSDHITTFALRHAQGLKQDVEERKEQWLRHVDLPVKLLHLLLPACRLIRDVHPDQSRYDGLIVYFVKSEVVPVHGEEWNESSELCELLAEDEVETEPETEGPVCKRLKTSMT